MREIKDFIANFEASRPIFALTLSGDSKRVSSNVSTPVHKYVPSPATDSLIEALACEAYNETFSSSRMCFTVDRDNIAKSVMNEIRHSIPKFLMNHMEMKNPRQSKLWKWFAKEMPANDSFNTNLIMIYKYLRSFSDENMRSSDTTHVKNALALLELIQYKHEQK
jgi:hypothetical protein